MNNAKMWLVVKPTVGLPLFLGAVAVGSFAVHLSILRNTTWLPAYLSGKPVMTSAVTPDTLNSSTAAVIFEQGSKDATVVLPDGRVAKVTFEAPRAQTASLPQ